MTFEASVEWVEVVALELDPPLVLDVGTSTREVIGRMREQRLGYALLTEDGKLAGILTERDVLHKVVGVADALDQPVSTFMHAEPVSVMESDPVGTAAHRMHEQGYRYIPVVDAANRVVGCVRHKDIIRYLVWHLADQVLSLPPDPDRVADTPEGG